MSSNEVAVTPDARIKLLADNATVDINPSVKAICYVRTLKELVRSAEAYYEEGRLDSAYLLYMRFLTLSLEKIKDHPGYADLPDVEKKQIRANCKHILPIAEKIKADLHAKYEGEYKDYLEALRLREEEEKKREVERIEKREQSKSLASSALPLKAWTPTPSAPPAPYDVTHGTKAALSAISAVNYDFGIDNSIMTKTPARPYKNDSEAVPLALQPHFDRGSKPSRFLSPMGTDSLRAVVIPGDLIPKFTSLASSNTLQNVETCGVLCGKIIKDQLVISHLVLPKQKGSPDSCTTLKEEEIYKIIDKYSLIQIGWIHTHPSQTSFLSSVDLHTHLSYQLMLSESVAIVVAPSKQQFNVFTLTNVGIDALLKCADSGFHPHPQLDEPYFINATHAHFESTRYIIVEDLRH